jgi:hypothetical protein
MVTRRRLSRDVRRHRLAGRDELASELETAIANVLRAHEPTLPVYGVRIASAAAATVASQLAVQTQTNQRALLLVEDEIAAHATDFVQNMVFAATKTVSKKLGRFHAALPTPAEHLRLPEDWAGPVAGPTAIERHFGIPRSTLFRWQKRNEAIAINSRSSSKPVFPLRQFLDGRPVDGLAEVISVLGNQKEAWKWLVTPYAGFHGEQPINCLLDGSISEVIKAAENGRPASRG